MSEKLEIILKLMMVMGMYWERPYHGQKLKNVKKMTVRSKSRELFERKKRSLNSAKIWSFLLLMISTIGTFIYAGTLAYYTFDANDSNLIYFIGNTFWNYTFSGLSIFLMIWVFSQNAKLSRFVHSMRQLVAEYDLDIPWKTNFFALYILSALFAVISIISDLTFSTLNCTLESSQCTFINILLSVMWVRFILIDIALSLFFWCITAILSQSLFCCLQRFVNVSDAFSKPAFTSPSSGSLNGCFINFEEKLTTIFVAVDSLMQFLGWPMLLRCLYDMSSTAIALYFFIDLATSEQISTINVVFVFAWRGFGILAHASSADFFNKSVSKIYFFQKLG